MTALRFPLAAGSGVLCTLTLFSVLLHFVSQPIDVGPIVEPFRIAFTPQIKPTPIESKRVEKPEREPPQLEPQGLKIGGPQKEGLQPTPVRRQPIARPQGEGFRVGGGSDRDVLPIVRVAPDYPPRPLANGTEGWVKVQFSITAAGTVKDAFVVEAEPRTVFDKAALKAIARWRYNPRVEGGVPVERVGLQTVIRFTIE